MAGSSEPLLLSEDNILDVNENMRNSQNRSFSNDEPVVDSTVSSIICPENDSAFMETSISSEITGACMKTSYTCSETPSNNVATRINMDEFASNRKTNSDFHDSENNIVENAKFIEFDVIKENSSENCDAISDFIHEENYTDFDVKIQKISDNSEGVISDFVHEENFIDFKDEEFHDALQFFKDPSSLVFLENAGSSNVPAEPTMTRSSLYQKFDPLHAKFFSQTNMKSNELQGIAEDEIESDHNKLESAFTFDDLPNEVETDKTQNNSTVVLIEVASDRLQSSLSEKHVDDLVPDIINKHLSNISPRQSLGNVLISFESPVNNKETESCVENAMECDPPKIYTEEDLQQILKIQELTIQETFLKKQQELEESFIKKQQELEAKVEQQKCLSSSLYTVLKDVVDFIYVLSDKEKQMKEKLQVTELENNKLKEDLKTSVEDIQSVETTFSDFHKRYEQCKNMLKVYTENEKSLKQQLESMNTQLHEKEEKYKALQSRTQEMLEKADAEVSNTKKAGDAQVAVLKAQLKKAELKISSLESDVKHIKIENGKLSSICDELMAKVSET